MRHRSDLPQGTLDLLILHVVAAGAMHGYGIAQRLQQNSRDVVQVYRLTPKGRSQLKEEEASWLRLTEAVGLILKTAGGSR